MNSGVSTIDKVGDIPGFGTVWLHREGIANIISLHLVKSKGFKIDYDISKEDAFLITKSNDKMPSSFLHPMTFTMMIGLKSSGTIQNTRSALWMAIMNMGLC